MSFSIFNFPSSVRLEIFGEWLEYKDVVFCGLSIFKFEDLSRFNEILKVLKIVLKRVQNDVVTESEAMWLQKRAVFVAKVNYSRESLESVGSTVRYLQLDTVVIDLSIVDHLENTLHSTNIETLCLRYERYDWVAVKSLLSKSVNSSRSIELFKLGSKGDFKPQTFHYQTNGKKLYMNHHSMDEVVDALSILGELYQIQLPSVGNWSTKLFDSIVQENPANFHSLAYVWHPIEAANEIMPILNPLHLHKLSILKHNELLDFDAEEGSLSIMFSGRYFVHYEALWISAIEQLHFRVKSLSLWYNSVVPAVLDALVRCGHVATLEELWLHNKPETTSHDHLCERLKHAARLRIVQLDGDFQWEAVLAALAASACADTLKEFTCYDAEHRALASTTSDLLVLDQFPHLAVCSIDSWYRSSSSPTGHNSEAVQLALIKWVAAHPTVTVPFLPCVSGTTDSSMMFVSPERIALNEAVPPRVWTHVIVQLSDEEGYISRVIEILRKQSRTFELKALAKAEQLPQLLVVLRALLQVHLTIGHLHLANCAGLRVPEHILPLIKEWRVNWPRLRSISCPGISLVNCCMTVTLYQGKIVENCFQLVKALSWPVRGFILRTAASKFPVEVMSLPGHKLLTHITSLELELKPTVALIQRIVSCRLHRLNQFIVRLGYSGAGGARDVELLAAYHALILAHTDLKLFHLNGVTPYTAEDFLECKRERLKILIK